jgi:hypothetical protein
MKQKKGLNMKKLFFIFMMITTFLIPIFCQSSPNTGSTSIAMLNYLATETRIISSSRDSRLVLEGIYNKLINNTNPSVIDITTQDYLLTLLDNIESFRMLTIQRERLQYIFENEQAQAITSAMPNPLYLLGARDMNPLTLIATAAAMTIDSFFKFQSAQNSAEMEFLKNNWELDDEESKTLHDLRTMAFSYMIDTARDYQLTMSETLNEISIDNFVKYTQDENLQRRRQTLETNKALYEKYAPYWLVLAETYYDLEMFEECINAIQQYEKNQAPIFRQERDFARIIPKLIIALSNVYGTNRQYVSQTNAYLEKLIENITDEDWALRYFAAQTYISLAGINDRQFNLNKAYNLLVQNVTVLSKEQENLLNTYLAPIDETIPMNTLKEQENEMEKVIRELKNKRYTELPPMHKGLLSSYQTLSSLQEELRISTSERNRINAIVDKSFVNPKLRRLYFNEGYNNEHISLSTSGIFTKKLKFTLPAVYLNNESLISMSISEDTRKEDLEIVYAELIAFTPDERTEYAEEWARIAESYAEIAESYAVFTMYAEIAEELSAIIKNSDISFDAIGNFRDKMNIFSADLDSLTDNIEIIRRSSEINDIMASITFPNISNDDLMLDNLHVTINIYNYSTDEFTNFYFKVTSEKKRTYNYILEDIE